MELRKDERHSRSIVHTIDIVEKGVETWFEAFKVSCSEFRVLKRYANDFLALLCVHVCVSPILERCVSHSHVYTFLGV